MYNSMYYNNPYLQQQPIQQPQQTNQGFSMIPVSNVEEANAYRVDMFGTPTFFYNASKGEVYLKKTNQSGLVDFATFSLVAKPTTSEKVASNVNTYEKDFKALNDKLDILLAKEKPEDYSLIEKKKKKGVTSEE